jgi:hypothetical protein
MELDPKRALELKDGDLYIAKFSRKDDRLAHTFSMQGGSEDHASDKEAIFFL